MPRKALIIKNIEGIQYNDLKIALEGIELNNETPEEVRELLNLIQSDKVFEKNSNKALSLFKLVNVRDYIYKTVKEKTGNHVIYHLNGMNEDGITNDIQDAYIIEKILQIPADTHFDMLYLGGGHGHPFSGSSMLSVDQLKNITDALNSLNTKYSSVILGSCFSAAYAGLYQPLLKNDGVMISNSLECGDDFFDKICKWLKGSQQEFYSNEDIDQVISPQEIRTPIKCVLKGTELNGQALDEYTILIDNYKEQAQIANPDLPEDILYEQGDELLNDDLEHFIRDVQSKKSSINKEIIQEALINYPLLDDYIKIIVENKSEKVIFDALINNLKPALTSLVIGTKDTLTLFNYYDSEEKPLNADENFQRNYGFVLRKVKYSDAFSTIQEVTENFNDISAKTQFNKLFVEATKLKVLPQKEEKLETKITNPESISVTQEITNPVNISLTQERFEELLEQLKIKMDQLIAKGAATNLSYRQYKNAKSAAERLIHQLETAKDEFFQKEISLDTYGTFKNKCTDAIEEAKEEFQHHRGWHAINPILKGLVGVLATLTVIPALIVHGTCRNGYMATFFTSPRTDSIEKLESFEQELIV